MSLRSLAPNTIATVLVAALAAPLVAMQLVAVIGSSGDHGYGVLLSYRAGSVVATTVFLTVGSVMFALVVGAILAISVAHLPPSFSWFGVVPVLSMAIPPVAAVIGWVFMLTPNVGYLNGWLRSLPFFQDLTTGPLDVYTLPAMIFVTGLVLVPFVVVYISAGLNEMDRTLMEAAKVFGARPLRIYLSIILPLLRPSILYATAVVTLLGLGQFTAPLLLGLQQGIRVVTTEMYSSAAAAPPDFATAAAWGSPLILLGFLLLAGQRWQLAMKSRFVVGNARGGGVGFSPSVWAIVPIVVFFIVAIVMPLFGMTIVALSPFWSSSIQWHHMGLGNIVTVLQESATLDAVLTTLITAVLGTLMAILLGYFIATTLVFGRRVHPAAKVALDIAANLPISIPSIVFGVGILIVYAGPPLRLYGTYAIFVIAYMTLVIPHSIRVLSAGMLAAGNSATESARVCGAGSIALHSHILIPMLRRQLAGAAVICLAILTHEFGASVLVRSTGNQVMGTLLYEYYNTGLYPMVGAMALIMTVVTGALIIGVMLLGGRSALDEESL